MVAGTGGGPQFESSLADSGRGRADGFLETQKLTEVESWVKTWRSHAMRGLPPLGWFGDLVIRRDGWRKQLHVDLRIRYNIGKIISHRGTVGEFQFGAAQKIIFHVKVYFDLRHHASRGRRFRLQKKTTVIALEFF